jgi:HPt (histidine-containing phosphotransfer) domain-containing protein
MNGHVGKPFDLNHLVSVLQRLATQSWVRPDARLDETLRQAQGERITNQGERIDNPYPVRVAPQSVRADASSVRAEPVEALTRAAQAAGVDLDAALNRLGHNLALYQRTLRMFVADLQAMPTQLRAHQVAQDTAQAIRLLHTLKGLAATLGASALAGVAGEGEAQLKSPNSSLAASPDLPTVVERTCMAIAQASPGLMALQTALQANMASASANAPAPDTPLLDTAALALALTELANKLHNFDMDAVQLMATLKHRFGTAIQAQTSHSLKPLEEAIDALDFAQAKGLCQTLHTLTKDT